MEIEENIRNSKNFSWLLSAVFVILFYTWIYYIVNPGIDITSETLVFILINVSFLFVISVLIIVQIVNAIIAVKRGDVYYCLKGLLFFKYTLISATLIFIALSLMILGAGVSVSMVLMMFPGGIIIAPFLAAISFLLPPVLLTIIFVAALPGLVCGICAIILTKKKQNIGWGQVILHIILQLIPVADLIDALVISISYWKMGKVLAIVSATAFVAVSILFGIFL